MIAFFYILLVKVKQTKVEGKEVEVVEVQMGLLAEDDLGLKPLVKTKIIEEEYEVEKVKLEYILDSPINMNELGDFKVVGFCGCELCRDMKSGKDIMSNYEGVNIVVDNNEIPYGSKVWVEGVGIRQTQPNGHKVKGKNIKVYFGTHKEVVDFGERTLKVYAIKD